MKLKTYIRAGYSALYCLSSEEDRITSQIAGVANELKYQPWQWDVAVGLSDSNGRAIDKTADPIAALNAFIKYSQDKEGNPIGTHVPNKSIVIFKDLHLFLKSSNPMIIRAMKNAITIGRATNRHIIILGCALHLPPELEKDITVIEFTLPTRDELRVVAESVAKSAKQELNGNTEAILDAMSGLTISEAADAAAFSKVEVGEIDAGVVGRIKADTIKKNGVIEVVESKITLDDIGGLELYKEHLNTISRCFTKEARDYGLPSPRPVLACGQPGTGKSMSAMACRNVFNIPLLRLEAGKLFGSLVGESERNWRTAFSTAKAIAPAIVWTDEAEALFGGSESSGKCDGGTTNRVVKAVLQDMQFNGDGLFFVFTSNDIDAFPDALIDRCDVWSFELPTVDERETIWKIHIAKRKRNPDAYNLVHLAKASDGYSGRQIEQAWLKAMMIAFNAGREPDHDDIMISLASFVPTAVTMAEQIRNRSERLKNRARPASKQYHSAPVKLERKIA